MAIYNKPDESVFASNARRGEVSNFPDIGRGWGISFDQTGGIPPMEWFNFLFKRTDEKFGYLFQRGLSEWSATQSYPDGALVQYKNLTYKAKRANTNKKPDEAQSSDWQRWGFTQSELGIATLTGSGITQLLTSINSNDETKSATPKSVKMAYDKGVEAKKAADAAQRTANDGVSKANAAQSTANDGVSKANAAQRTANDGVSKANAAQSTANDGVSKANAAQRTANDGVSKANAAQRTANDGVSKANAAQRSADNANTNANGRVSKSGDVIDGDLKINGQNGAWSRIQFGSKNSTWDLEFHPDANSLNNRRFNVRHVSDSSVYLAFPHISDNGETVAYRSWVEDRTTPWGKIDGKPEFATRWPSAAEQGYSHSLNSSGWTKLPSGLILQWGKTPVIHDESTTNIVFPIVFPNKVLSVQLTENQMRTTANHATHLAALNVSNTKFTFKMNSTLPIDTSADWFAIGY